MLIGKGEMARVTMYSRKLCGYCFAARKLLEEKGVDLEEVDATFSPELREEMMERTGRSTFPQIFIGDAHIGGFSELNQLEHNGVLDEILEKAA